MGQRGPIPKDSENRIRRHAPANEMIHGEAGRRTDAPIEADEDWHPVARLLWDTTEDSGQSAYYEQTDWASLYLLCEQLTRELNPQFIGMRELPTTWEINPVSGEREMTSSGGTQPMSGVVPIKGATLTAVRAMMAVLLMTEGDRRRIQMELKKVEPGTPTETAGSAAVASIKEHLLKKKGQQSS